MSQVKLRLLLFYFCCCPAAPSLCGSISLSSSVDLKLGCSCPTFLSAALPWAACPFPHLSQPKAPGPFPCKLKPRYRLLQFLKPDCSEFLSRKASMWLTLFRRGVCQKHYQWYTIMVLNNRKDFLLWVPIKRCAFCVQDILFGIGLYHFTVHFPVMIDALQGSCGWPNLSEFLQTCRELTTK